MVWRSTLIGGGWAAIPLVRKGKNRTGESHSRFWQVYDLKVEYLIKSKLVASY